MPDTTHPSGVVARVREWVEDSYPVAVIRRFVELEVLERSVGLAAQAFIAMLPLVILTVSFFVSDVGTAVSEQVGDRFGLDSVTRQAISALFWENGATRTISWLAVIMVLVSAFALARRLGRMYATIFDVPALARRDNWRGLVWIGLQLVMLLLASNLRQLRVDSGLGISIAAVIGLIGIWLLTDIASLRLLVPSAAVRLVVASAVVSTIGRVGMGAWSAVYFANSLSEQAASYGPIGVSFALFTYLLVAVLVYVGSPLLVTTWVTWRAEQATPAASVSS